MLPLSARTHNTQAPHTPTHACACTHLCSPLALSFQLALQLLSQRAALTLCEAGGGGMHALAGTSSQARVRHALCNRPQAFAAGSMRALSCVQAPQQHSTAHPGLLPPFPLPASQLPILTLLCQDGRLPALRGQQAQQHAHNLIAARVRAVLAAQLAARGNRGMRGRASSTC